jgi:hypothetical protein
MSAQEGVWRQERFRDAVLAIGAREFRGGQGVYALHDGPNPADMGGRMDIINHTILSERQQQPQPLTRERRDRAKLS